jgi:hypothetical protein
VSDLLVEVGGVFVEARPLRILPGDYDVPRPNGFYWVVWYEGDAPEPAKFVAVLHTVFTYAGPAAYLYQKWQRMGCDEASSWPMSVLCGCELPGAPGQEFR